MLTQKLDKVGVFASLACSVHCALLPIVISALPLLGLAWLADERIEICFLALSALLALFSLCLGFRTHRKMHALAIMAAGVACMAVGHISEGTTWGVFVAVAGGLSIATSHLINHRLCTTCHNCESCS